MNKPMLAMITTAVSLLCGCSLLSPTEMYQDNQLAVDGQPTVHSAYTSGVNCVDQYHASKQLEKNNNEAPSNLFPVSTINDYNELPLSPGDLIELHIEFGDLLNGKYTVDAGGVLALPFMEPMHVAGLKVKQIEQTLSLELIKQKLFKPSSAMPVIKIIEYSAIEVPVSGAVFSAGRQRINKKDKSSNEAIITFGDFTPTRMLSEALRAASGVRPDADLQNVQIIRNGWIKTVDVSGIFSGELTADYPLISGDRVFVPSTGCFQPELVRPSQITPKGFRIFMSNLLTSNRTNSDLRYVTNLPYGSNLLQAAISSNCVGGSSWANADRKVVLVSINPVSRRTHIVEGDIETMMKNANNLEANPYVMPNDAVACYDSRVDNLRQVASALFDVLRPFTLF